jgi:multisubunit Na+/H+ antiporter MnhF subunit
MRSRPPTVTVAAILLVLLSLFNFPWLYRLLFPGTVEPPAIVIYSGYVLGIVSLLVAIGLWRLNKWSYWATIVVCVLNFLSGAPGYSLRQAEH